MLVLPGTWQQNRKDAFDLKRLFHGQQLLGLFLAPGIGERLLIAAICSLSLLAVWFLVWQSALYVYVHLAYVPITIAALFYGGWGGVLCGIAAGILVPLLQRHEREQPQVQIRVFDSSPAEILQLVESATAAFGVTVQRGSSPRLDSERIAEEAFVLVCPQSHAWAARASQPSAASETWHSVK